MTLEQLQNAMANNTQADCPVKHHFTDGLYARELFIPKGVALVGARHKTNHMYVMLSGHCIISTDGENPFEAKAGMIAETKAGTKKAFYALEDSVFMSFHVTNKTDVESIGDEILHTEQNVIPMWKTKCLENKSCG